VAAPRTWLGWRRRQARGKTWSPKYGWHYVGAAAAVLPKGGWAASAACAAVDFPNVIGKNYNMSEFEKLILLAFFMSIFTVILMIIVIGVITGMYIYFTRRSSAPRSADQDAEASAPRGAGLDGQVGAPRSADPEYIPQEAASSSSDPRNAARTEPPPPSKRIIKVANFETDFNYPPKVRMVHPKYIFVSGSGECYHVNRKCDAIFNRKTDERRKCSLCVWDDP
jgi:hypothetical protein